MNILNPLVDRYLADGCGRCSLGGTPKCKVNNWPAELKQLRQIVLDCGLSEEIKWGVPCYTFEGHNIAIVSAFKEYASLSFFKGVLLKDTAAILAKPGENSQSARLIRFTSVRDIRAIADTLKDYIREAIELERRGLKPDFEAKNELVIPDELQSEFEKLPALKTAFFALTPGRQRGYILHFAAAKQSKTRVTRIEKCIPKILDGQGFNEYRS